MTSPSFLLPQAGFPPSELALSSPGPLSPSGVKGGTQYYSYSGHPRRRAADSGLGEWGGCRGWGRGLGLGWAAGPLVSCGAADTVGSHGS